MQVRNVLLLLSFLIETVLLAFFLGIWQTLEIKVSWKSRRSELSWQWNVKQNNSHRVGAGKSKSDQTTRSISQILETKRSVILKYPRKKFKFFHKNSPLVFKTHAQVWDHNQLTFNTINMALILIVFEPNLRRRLQKSSVTGTWQLHFDKMFDSLTFINSLYYPVLSDHACRKTSLSVPHASM